MAMLEAYATLGGDDGLTEDSMRIACGLKARNRTEDAARSHRQPAQPGRRSAQGLAGSCGCHYGAFSKRRQGLLHTEHVQVLGLAAGSSTLGQGDCLETLGSSLLAGWQLRTASR